MGRVAENLARLGLELPDPPAAVGAYVPWIRTGNLVVTSGQLPWSNRVMHYVGRLGEEVTEEEGYQAARLSALNAIAQLHQAADGDLDRVRIVRVEGNVHCGESFRGHPKVLDGASELFVAVFGDHGRHVRTALGIAAMPLNASVQLSVWAEISDGPHP